jgi:hypothetical protein
MARVSSLVDKGETADLAGTRNEWPLMRAGTRNLVLGQPRRSHSSSATTRLGPNYAVCA